MGAKTWMLVYSNGDARELPAPSAPDMDKLIALAAKYRVEILGPLPE